MDSMTLFKAGLCACAFASASWPSNTYGYQPPSPAATTYLQVEGAHDGARYKQLHVLHAHQEGVAALFQQGCTSHLQRVAHERKGAVRVLVPQVLLKPAVGAMQS